MDIGPVEYIIIDFPGNQFNGDLLPALEELVASDTVRIIDLLIVSKDSAGNITIVELADNEEVAALFDDLAYEVLELFNEEDIELIAAEMPNDSTAALMVWENVWATTFAKAVRDAGGIVVDNARIPHDIVQAALDYVEDED